MSLSLFHQVVARWFAETLGEPTAPQLKGWPAIRAGRHTLIAAPTGSGKTLAAFLTVLDELFQEGLRAPLPDEVRVVYVSPLKALSADVHKNLSEPRRGLRRIAEELGLEAPRITAAVRTGDTTSAERAAMLRTPPHILVTTPESLYLLLTAERSREMLRTARTVIVDEIHAVIGTRRGAHLALSLERLEQIVRAPLVRIGLSATQKPLDEVARFLVGVGVGSGAGSESTPERGRSRVRSGVGVGSGAGSESGPEWGRSRLRIPDGGREGLPALPALLRFRAALRSIDVRGFAEEYLRRFHDGLGQRRMRMDGELEVAGGGAHLDRQDAFRHELAGIRADEAHAENPLRVGIEHELGETVGAVERDRAT
jgi:RAD3-like DEAD/DEAH box helicase